MCDNTWKEKSTDKQTNRQTDLNKNIPVLAAQWIGMRREKNFFKIENVLLIFDVSIFVMFVKMQKFSSVILFERLFVFKSTISGFSFLFRLVWISVCSNLLLKKKVKKLQNALNYLRCSSIVMPKRRTPNNRNINLRLYNEWMS